LKLKNGPLQNSFFSSPPSQPNFFVMENITEDGPIIVNTRFGVRMFKSGATLGSILNVLEGGGTLRDNETMIEIVNYGHVVPPGKYTHIMRDCMCLVDVLTGRRMCALL
jgi:hypothetical protein